MEFTLKLKMLNSDLMSLKHESVEEKVKNFSQDAEKKKVDGNDESNDRAREHWTFTHLIFFLFLSEERVSTLRIVLDVMQSTSETCRSRYQTSRKYNVFLT